MNDVDTPFLTYIPAVRFFGQSIPKGLTYRTGHIDP